MKKLLCFIMAASMMFACTAALAWDSSASAISDNAAISGEINYLEGMLDASEEGTDDSVEIGSLFEHFRNITISVNNLPYQTTQFFAEGQSADDINLAIRSYMGLPYTDNVEETITLDSSESYVVDISSLNCRASASSEGAIVGAFSKGTVVTALEVNGDWYRVTDGIITGWVMSCYLVPQEEDNMEIVEPISYSEDDLYWLALCISVEAGASWASDEHQLMVGNVVLNRVASDLFPDTIYDVLHQPGQYPWVNYNISNFTITDRAIENARRLLNGERYCPENVVFQAEFKQGNGVYLSIYDSVLNNTTYFCYL